MKKMQTTRSRRKVLILSRTVPPKLSVLTLLLLAVLFSPAESMWKKLDFHVYDGTDVLTEDPKSKTKRKTPKVSPLQRCEEEISSLKIKLKQMKDAKLQPTEENKKAYMKCLNDLNMQRALRQKLYKKRRGKNDPKTIGIKHLAGPKVLASHHSKMLKERWKANMSGFSSLLSKKDSPSCLPCDQANPETVVTPNEHNQESDDPFNNPLEADPNKLGLSADSEPIQEELPEETEPTPELIQRTMRVEDEIKVLKRRWIKAKRGMKRWKGHLPYRRRCEVYGEADSVERALDKLKVKLCKETAATMDKLELQNDMISDYMKKQKDLDKKLRERAEKRNETALGTNPTKQMTKEKDSAKVDDSLEKLLDYWAKPVKLRDPKNDPTSDFIAAFSEAEDWDAASVDDAPSE